MEEQQLLEPSGRPRTNPSSQNEKQKLSKREIGLIITIVLAIIGVGLFAWWTGRSQHASVQSFADCVAAGHEVMDSYPEQCRANDQTFYNITTFEQCRAAGFPIQESYPERCAAQGQSWTNPEQDTNTEQL